jgi:hypothetical protein
MFRVVISISGKSSTKWSSFHRKLVVWRVQKKPPLLREASLRGALAGRQLPGLQGLGKCCDGGGFPGTGDGVRRGNRGGEPRELHGMVIERACHENFMGRS